MQAQVAERKDARPEIGPLCRKQWQACLLVPADAIYWISEIFALGKPAEPSAGGDAGRCNDWSAVAAHEALLN